MQVQKLQTNNYNPQFKMKILPTESVKYAVLTSRNMIESPNYYDTHRGFVRTFCNSLARILKSKQAERIWASVCRGSRNEMTPSYVEEYYKTGESKHVLSLNSIQENEHRYGDMAYSQEGGNMMRTLIEYSKTIKDVPEQNLNLKTDAELANYAYDVLKEDLHNDITGFYNPGFKI